MKYVLLPQFLISYFAKRHLHQLETSDVDKLLRKSDKLAIDAFRRASEKVPAYKELLKENGVNPDKVQTIEDFKRLVPIIDKNVPKEVNCHEFKTLFP